MSKAQTPLPAEARALAKEAYMYVFSIVDSYRIQYSYFVDRKDREYKGNLEHDPKHCARLHAGRQGNPDSQFRHSVFKYQRRSEDRAAGLDFSPGKSAPPAAPRIDFRKPISAEEECKSLQFFKVLNFVLQFCPTHPFERELIARFATLDIGAAITVPAIKEVSTYGW